MTQEQKLELLRRVCLQCDQNIVDVYALADALTKVTGFKHEAACSCHSVAGRLCREAQGILAQMEKNAQ